MKELYDALLEGDKLVGAVRKNNEELVRKMRLEFLKDYTAEPMTDEHEEQVIEKRGGLDGGEDLILI